MWQESGDEAATILAVDDEELNRELMEANLVPEGYDVVTAADGPGALEVLAARHVDLVLLDVMMPGMSGFETCRRIRKDPGRSFLPVVFITALADRDSRVHALEVGGDDFLTKPIDEVALLARVRNLLRVKAYHDLRTRQQELLEQELDRTRAQLLHADRLATLGTLAAGVGHELSNIATVFYSTLFLLRQNIEGKIGSEALADLDTLARCCGHVTTHAKQMLDLGRPDADPQEPVEVGEVVMGTMEMLHLTGRTKYMTVEPRLPEAPVLVPLGRTQLEQVLLNLVGNAADALASDDQSKGLIQISVHTEATGRWVVCRVEDNGPGLPPGTEEDVFEPYFTTKPAGKGTGLGLVVVKNILEKAGGGIEVDSRPGEGTTFTIHIPRVPQDGSGDAMAEDS